MKSLLKIIPIVSLLTIIACGSDDNADTQEKPNNNNNNTTTTDALGSVSKVGENIQAIDIPEGLKNNDDPRAQEAELTFTYLKTLTSSFSSFLLIPDNATTTGLGQKNLGIQNTTTYTWSANGITINYAITDKGDSYGYVYNIISPDFSGKLFEGASKKDGSSFNLTIFEQDGTTSLMVTYDKSASTETLVMTTSEGEKIEFVSLSNGSGSIKVFEGASLTTEMKWNADGSGSLTDYEENETYTWTA